VVPADGVRVGHQHAGDGRVRLGRALRTLLPDSPPVLATVTAYTDFDHLTRAADAGFDLHFTKPASPVEIADELSRYLIEIDVQDGRRMAALAA